MGGKGGGTGWALAQVLNKGQQLLPFKKALLHEHSPKLKSRREWEAWCKSGAPTQM